MPKKPHFAKIYMTNRYPLNILERLTVREGEGGQKGRYTAIINK